MKSFLEIIKESTAEGKARKEYLVKQSIPYSIERIKSKIISTSKNGNTFIWLEPESIEYYFAVKNDIVCIFKEMGFEAENQTDYRDIIKISWE